MSISNGQPVNASASNSAWISKTSDDAKSGKLDLTNAGSGPTVTNTQQTINDIKDDVGTLQTTIPGVQSDISDLQTLSGLPDGSVDLGTFTGITIPDSSNTKDALQYLETEVELKENLSNKGIADGYASLDSGGKVPASQLPNSIMEYQGTWNASTNTPTLADGVGNAGDVYIVQVAGTQNLGSGSISFLASDWVVYNGSTWEKSSNSNSVVSVNGFTGVVTLAIDDISDVVLTAAANRDVLKFDGANWINSSLDISANDAATGSNATLTAIASSVVRLTSGSLVSIDMIPAGYSSQKFVLTNATGVSVLINNDTGATAANRILTGISDALTLENTASIIMVYDSTTTRWRVVGGSGSGGSSGSGGVNYLSNKNAEFENSTNDWVGKNANPGNSVSVDTVGETITVSAGFGGYVGMPILYTASATPIGGLTTATVYYIESLPVAAAFTLALTPGGSAINLTSAGTGTHTFTAMDPGLGTAAAASSNLTLTASATSPLYGTKSLTITKAAVDARGELACVLTDTVPIGYRGMPISCSFLVDASDANYVTGDLKFYLANVTDSKQINISSPTSQQIVNGKQLVQFFAYPAYTCASINLEVFVATTNALAYTVKVDSFKIRPAVDWQSTALLSNTKVAQSYTLTNTQGFGTPTGQYAYYAINGSIVTAWGGFLNGTVTSSEARISLPPNLTPSAGKYSSPTSAGIGFIPTSSATGFVNYPAAIVESGVNYIRFGANTSAGYNYAPGNAGATGIRTSWSVTYEAEELINNATSPYLITSTDEFTNESATFVQKTTALTGNEAPGTYNSFTGVTTSFVTTITSTAPTQTNASMSVDGMLLYSKAYNVNSTATQPVRLDIVIGKGMKYVNINAYASSGKVTPLSIDNKVVNATTEVGVIWSYNESTGILTLNGIAASLATNTSKFNGTDPITTNATAAVYMFIRASKKNAVTGVNQLSGIPVKATSSVKTPGANAIYLAMTGNSVTVGPGVWQIFGSVNFNNSGSSPAYTVCTIGLYGANGADTGSAPVAVSTLSGVTELSANINPETVIINTSDATAKTPSMILQVAGTATIYAVPFPQESTPSNSRITTYLNAVQIG